MAKAEKKLSWFKFYPQDWRGDTKLRTCSIGARGLWIEMVCIMHEAEPYGHLLLGGVPVANRQLAALAGISAKDCLTFMAELGSASVFSRDEAGVIFSRRMVRDRERSLKGKTFADLRWGNGDIDGSPISQPIDTPNGSPTREPKGKPITPESRNQIDDDGNAREPLVSDAARDLADELLVIAGHELRFVPPGWCGAAMRVHTWLAQGWPREIILIGARKATAKNRGRQINSVQFYENTIAEEIARQAEPLPQVDVRQPEKLTVIANGKSQGGNIIQASDRLADTIRSFDAGPGETDAIRSGAGAPNVRLLSQG